MKVIKNKCPHDTLSQKANQEGEAQLFQMMGFWVKLYGFLLMHYYQVNKRYISWGAPVYNHTRTMSWFAYNTHDS